MKIYKQTAQSIVEDEGYVQDIDPPSLSAGQTLVGIFSTQMAQTYEGSYNRLIVVWEILTTL